MRDGIDANDSSLLRQFNIVIIGMIWIVSPSECSMGFKLALIFHGIVVHVFCWIPHEINHTFVHRTIIVSSVPLLITLLL